MIRKTVQRFSMAIDRQNRVCTGIMLETKNLKRDEDLS